MNLAELLADLERRAAEAEEIHAMAPVADVYRYVLRALQEVGDAPSVDVRDRLISVADASARLSVSTRYIYAHKKELPYVRLSGAMVRCSEFAVERQIKAVRPAL